MQNQEPNGEKDAPRKKSTFGLVAFGVVAATTGGLFAVTAAFIAPALRKICLPYVPATNVQLENVVKALKHPKRHGSSLVDIGSGDGRVVIKAAKHGFKSVGIELNRWLVVYSKCQAWKNGVSSNARFIRGDLWKTDYSVFDNVVIFGVDQMMPDLEKKLQVELKVGSKIVACRFPFPNIPIQSTHGKGVDQVWTYLVTNQLKEINLRHSSN